ncbi:putative mitochondrial protein AtMg00860 [Nicotiana tabacum]|uniref:Mitochondrial protein AtMg00860 n=1 Tax=Nicotiana tabacum TaxID=4097 RepID=A0AC58T2R9_TOBAC
MGEAKVRAIHEWEAPIKVTELRSFLGLVNCYHQFISGYSAKAAPLTELLKKNKPWVWTEHCQKAFEDFKAAVTEDPVLVLPDFAKTFEDNVVDRFSKYATFMPASQGCIAKEAAKLFFKNVVKYWGIPRHIISDRDDPHFTGNLWRDLLNILGMELRFSTSFHPQTDGQTEWVNVLLECYLRHSVRAYQKDWARLLDIA